MPFIEVHLLAGRSPETKAALVRDLTSVVARTVGSDPQRIHVLVTEYQQGDWAVGGEPLVRETEAL